MLLFAGCESDSDYVNRVKNMNLDSGGTVEEYVISLIEAEDHCNVYGACTEHAIKLIAISSEKAMLESVRSVNLKYPRIGDIKWEVEGKTSNGKILLATADKYFVKIPTQQDGDYIKLNTGNFTVYDKNTKAKLDDKTNQIGRFKLAYIREIGYIESNDKNTIVKTEEKVNSEEDEFEDIHHLEFYKSGRIKKISPKDPEATSIPILEYDDVPIDFNSLNADVKSLEDDINAFIKGKNSSSNTEYSELDPELEIRIEHNELGSIMYGLQLSKNLSEKEKSRLIALGKKVEKLYDKYNEFRGY